MARIEIDEGDMLLTKVANGIHPVRVERVANGRVHYLWRDGALGSVALDEVGALGDSDRDFQFVTVPK